MSNRLSEEKEKLMTGWAEIASIVILNPSKNVNEMIDVLIKLAYEAHNNYYARNIN